MGDPARVAETWYCARSRNKLFLTNTNSRISLLGRECGRGSTDWLGGRKMRQEEKGVGRWGEEEEDG